METFGRHLLVELWGCEAKRLDDDHEIEALMRRAALAAEATIVQSVFHRFAPQGVSGVVVVEESHLSIHTWPETGYAAVDFYTCGECLPERAVNVLREGLRAERCEVMEVERGLRGRGASLRVSGQSSDAPPARRASGASPS